MSAQPSLDRLENPSIEILDHSGDLYSDGWLSASFGFRFRALVDIDWFALRFWNPDFAARYVNNHLTVTVDDVARLSPALFPGQMVHFKHQIGMLTDDICAVDLVSEQFCEADQLDPRERGVIFVGSSFLLTDSSLDDNTTPSESAWESDEPEEREP